MFVIDPYRLSIIQLKDMAERLPPGAYDPESLKLLYMPNGLEPNGIHYPDAKGERDSTSDTTNTSYSASRPVIDSAAPNRMQDGTHLLADSSGSNESILGGQASELATSNGTNESSNVRPLPNGDGNTESYRTSVSGSFDAKESEPARDSESGPKSRNPVVPSNASQIEAEWIEQYEPGVYITLVALRDGTRDLKRVRFRYFAHRLFFLYVLVYLR